jgi:hypothetical protein
MNFTNIPRNRLGSTFARVSSDDPSRWGECTDIPGFYGRPVGILNPGKRPSVFRAALRYVAFLALVYTIANFFLK